MGSLDSAGRVWSPCPFWAVTLKTHVGAIGPALLELIMSLHRHGDVCFAPALTSSRITLPDIEGHTTLKNGGTSVLSGGHTRFGQMGDWVENPASPHTSHVFTGRLHIFFEFVLSVKYDQ